MLYSKHKVFKIINLFKFVSCQILVYTHLIVNHLKTLITIFLVLASVHKCQTGFSLANISFTQNENASWPTFFKGHWFPGLIWYFWRYEIYLALFIFQNNTQLSYYLDKRSVDFHFICLSIICIIVLSTFLAFIYFTSQLHICYLTSCSFHPILHISMLVLLCSFALSDFVYMHFNAFIISIIKCYVMNSKLICACNRCCGAADPHDLSPALWFKYHINLLNLKFFVFSSACN